MPKLGSLLGLLAGLSLTTTFTAPAIAAAEPDKPPEFESSITIANPKVDGSTWKQGEQINFVVRLTNKTDKTRSFASTSSNLTDWQGCKWTALPPNKQAKCTFAYHVTTAEDAKTGFLPTIKWRMYSQTGYRGTSAELPETSGNKTSVSTQKAAAPKPAAEEQPAAPAMPAPAPSASTALPALAPAGPLPVRSHAAGYNIRIPAIAVATNGDLLAAYDLRPHDGGMNGGDSPNANWIMQRRSTDNGRTWQAETVVAQGRSGRNRLGFSDPSYVVDRERGTIFNFHVHSMQSGVFANKPNYKYDQRGRIDETDSHTMNLGLSVSTDNGHTWTQRVITDQVLGPIARKNKLLSCFATSGAGTQKTAPPNKGRLLQQAACIQDQNGNGISEFGIDAALAVTIYSDDHGKTWHAGTPTAPHEGGKHWVFDENKVVELSDGSLMLNSRTSGGEGLGYRIVGTSKDGGETWQDFRVDKNLIDPSNNAQIIRAFPNAKPGSAKAKVLLFSNTKSHVDRSNGTLWISYDDGNTWAASKTFRKGGTGYSTIAVLSDGNIGILYEPAMWADIGFTTTNIAWLDATATKRLEEANDAENESESNIEKEPTPKPASPSGSRSEAGKHPRNQRAARS